MLISDIAAKITTHLFVVCPNNSGSTFLSKALSTCRRTMYLEQEGQHTGFVGPVPAQEDLSLVWGEAGSNYGDVLADDANYDWPAIKNHWYRAARRAYRPEVCVFLEKSPPHIARVHLLAKHFASAKFVFMVRNPYAQVESICRARPNMPEITRRASEHSLTCLRLQRENIERYSASGVGFTYEAMCAEPAATAESIRQLAPELEDLKLDQEIAVKGRYKERLRDMNAQQIARLTGDQLAILRNTFAPHEALLRHFRYELLG